MSNHIHFLLFLLTSYISLLPSSPHSQIAPLVYGSSNGNFHILLEMGDPIQMVYLRIDMAQPSSWLTQDIYHPELSYSFSSQYDSSIQLNYFSYDSILSKETLQVQRKNFHLNNFYFHYLSTPRPEGTYDSLSLPYQFTDIKMSLIHQLYNNESILKKQFTFVPIDEDVGYIYLGYLPYEQMEEEHFKQIASCKVDPHYNTWGCNIDKVYIDTNVYASEHYAYFNPTTKETLVPYSFMSFFSETFMREYLDKKICEYNTGIDLYECECSMLNDIPKVVLMLGGETVELGKEVLFTSMNGKCQLKLKTNVMNMNWVFGTDFIEKHIVTFSYDKGKIEIYSNRTQSAGYSEFYYYITGGKKLTVGQILIVVVIALLVTIGIGGVYVKVRNWANRKKNKKRRKKFYANQDYLI